MSAVCAWACIYKRMCVCACVGVLAYGQMRLFVCVVILGMKRRTAKDGGKERM